MEEAKEKSVFDIFDRNANDSISKEDAVQALRVYGLNPTEDELAEIFAEHDPSSRFTFKNFCKLVKRCKQTSKVTKETVGQFLETFNKNLLMVRLTLPSEKQV